VKINGARSRKVLGLMCEISDQFIIFQQYNSRAQPACKLISLYVHFVNSGMTDRSFGTSRLRQWVCQTIRHGKKKRVQRWL